ncbi:MAG: hypothetical protein LBS59_06670 [Puniceicoccales bacterium]|jgi:hypothetical protein|nr:hypothetical protein [Puniceicoccales bacterium]
MLASIRKPFLLIVLIAIIVLSSVVTALKREQRNKIFSSIKEHEKNIKILEEDSARITARINDSMKRITDDAVLFLWQIEKDAIEDVRFSGGQHARQLRKARPGQIVPIVMQVPRLPHVTWDPSPAAPVTETVRVETRDRRDRS